MFQLTMYYKHLSAIINHCNKHTSNCIVHFYLFVLVKGLTL